MANNLNFKWGLHSGLKAMTSSDVGTLYFTKDEGGLYLGVDANQKPKRIQGIVQYYATLDAFKAEVLPPYSSEVIYYIADQNALVKWNGSKVTGSDKNSGEFVVLNVTASEFTAQVNSLNSSIGTNTSNINTLNEKVGAANAAPGTSTAFARIKQLENAVDALEEFVGSSSGGGSSLEDRISALESWQNDINGWKTTISSTVADNTSDIGALDTKTTKLRTDVDNIRADLGQKTDSANSSGSAFARIAAAVAAHNTLNNSVSTLEGEMDTAQQDIGNLKTTTEKNTSDITKNASDISGLQSNKVDNTDFNNLKDRVDGHDTTLQDHTTKIQNNSNAINNINIKIGTKTDAATATTVYGAINKVASDLGKEVSLREQLNEKVTTISNLLGDTSSEASASGDAYARIKNLQSRMGEVEAKNTAQDTAIGKAQQDATNAGAQAATNKTDITNLTSNLSNNYYTKTQIDAQHKTIEDKYDDAIESLGEQLDTHIKAANALTYKGGVTAATWADIKAQKAKIGDVYVASESSATYTGLENDGTTGRTVYAGDLIIATAKSGKSEDSDGELAAADIYWVHIESGYHKELEGKLEIADADGTNANKSVKLTLTSLNGGGKKGDLGAVTITSVSNNVDIVTSGSAVNVSLVWDTF